MEKIIKAILESLLAFFWPILNTPKEAENGEAVNDREEKLKEKIKRDTKAKTNLLIMVSLSLFYVTGCTTKTVYVPDGKAVQLRQRVKNCKVWVWDKDGKRVAGKMTLPEGWYALPLEEEEGNTNETAKTQ